MIASSLLLLSACNRVVLYEPPPDEVLPAGAELLTTGSYTPSGRGTEYRSTYWLVGVSAASDYQSTVDFIVGWLEDSGFETLESPAHDWASVALSDDNQAYVAIGSYVRFAQEDRELGASDGAQFSEATAAFQGTTFVILFAPIPGD